MAQPRPNSAKVPPQAVGQQESLWDLDLIEVYYAYSPPVRRFFIFAIVMFVVVNVIFFRLAMVLSRGKPSRRPKTSKQNPTHLLVVLGSGGHTAEMLNILKTQIPSLAVDFTHRTYVVSSGDAFSALKAVQFEKELASLLRQHGRVTEDDKGEKAEVLKNYDIVTIRRARRVHQGVITAPLTTLQCLWDSIQVLRGRHADFGPSKSKSFPDLILTNGPGTGVCVVLASILLLFLGISGPVSTNSTIDDENKTIQPYRSGGQMRTLFIESWARVRSLSLSGKILKPLVDRFIVQWPLLVQNEVDRAEYYGPLVA